MPKIFDENDKGIIREKLMKYGMEALKSGGYKAASVEAIARQAGIAKGTFYNFFQSKEHFFYKIVLSIRDKSREDFIKLITVGDKLDHSRMADFLFERYAENNNIYAYFTPDEIRIIFRKMPEQLSLVSLDSTAFAAELLAKVSNENPVLNEEVVVNIINIMGSFAAGNESESAGSRDETIRFLANALASYIMRGDN